MILKIQIYFIKALIERLVIIFLSGDILMMFSFCYGVFYKSDLIANVGMVSNKWITDQKKEFFLDIQAWYPKFRGLVFFQIY